MKRFLIIVLLMYSTFCQAQDDGYSTVGVYEFPKGSSTYVFNDTVNVREKPTQQSAVKDRLLKGAEVFIDSALSEKMTIGYKSAPWVQVHYFSNSQKRSGWIWAGTLCLKAMRRGDTKFLFNLVHKDESKKGDSAYWASVELQAFQGNTVADSKQFRVYYESLAFVDASVVPGKGLTGLKHLVKMYFSGEACGVPTLTQYIGWNGEKLFMLPLLTDVGDAGVFYSSETGLFPSDKNGKPDKLIVLLKSVEVDEHEKEHIKTGSNVWRWNGSDFVLDKAASQPLK